MAISYEILLPGIPVTSPRGALGWCTVALIRHEEKTILFDVGSFNVRPHLVEELRKRGLSPGDMDMVFISHSHFDHVVNAELFVDSQILISKSEYEHVFGEGPQTEGDHYIPFSLMTLLKDRFHLLEGDEYLLTGIKAVNLPGHTPGHMGLYLEEEGTILAGDAVKNAWEFVHGMAPPPYWSEEESLRTYERIRSMARTLIPGHDRPFHLLGGKEVQYTQDWSAEITAYGDPQKDPEIIRLP